MEKEYTVTKDYKKLLKKGDKVMLSEASAEAYKKKGLIGSAKKAPAKKAK